MQLTINFYYLQIIVVPIESGVGKIDMKQIKDIVGPGNDGNILTDAVERGFQALDKILAAKISQVMCKHPCDHWMHDHDKPGNQDHDDYDH